jgi:hypothetical protein
MYKYKQKLVMAKKIKTNKTKYMIYIVEAVVAKYNGN